MADRLPGRNNNLLNLVIFAWLSEKLIHNNLVSWLRCIQGFIWCILFLIIFCFDWITGHLPAAGTCWYRVSSEWGIEGRFVMWFGGLILLFSAYLVCSFHDAFGSEVFSNWRLNKLVSRFNSVLVFVGWGRVSGRAIFL